MFKGKIAVLLLVFITLLVVFPVSAADNLTSDISLPDDYCLESIDDVNSTYCLSNQLSGNDDINSDIIASENPAEDGFDDVNVIGASDISYNWLSTNIISDDLTQYAIDYNAGERGKNFYVWLIDQNGNGLANKTINIGFNGITREIVTDGNGWAHMQINLASADKYTFAVIFLGDNTYSGLMKVNTITVNKKPTTISASAKKFSSKAKTKKYTITLKTKACSSANGKVYLSAGKKITLKLKGKTYAAKTGKNGKATFKIKLTKKGKFKATIKFAGDKTYKASSKTAYITIK